MIRETGKMGLKLCKIKKCHWNKIPVAFFDFDTILWLMIYKCEA